MKISPVEAEFFHADGQTDGRTDRHNIKELIVAFCNFATASKKCMPGTEYLHINRLDGVHSVQFVTCGLIWHANIFIEFTNLKFLF